MARKSKDAVLRNRLSSISDCPFDIFNYVDEATVFELLPRCEGGDSDAIVALCHLIFDAHGDNRADSLEYLLRLGIDRKIEDCATLAVDYIAHSGAAISLARDSLELVGGVPMGDSLRVYAMLAISEQDAGLIDTALLSSPEYAGVLLYLLPRDDGRINDIAELAEVPSIVHLPSFNGGDGFVNGNTDGLMTYIRWLTKFSNPVWQDFWLRCAYEYASSYGGIYDFARLAIEVIKSRSYCERYPIYMYALNVILSPNESHEKMRKRCKFEGFDCENLDTGAILREAVYISSPTQIVKAMEREILGGVIIHTRNRYSLTHDLSGHGKRARLHFWELLLSIEAEDSPTFTEVRVEEVRCAPIRNEVELEREPTVCQLICRSELILGGVRHPFQLDLVADISFISATKCQSIEIEYDKVERNGKYITLNSRLYLK